MFIPPIVPEDGVLWRFPVWSLAECDHCGLQEEHIHTVGDSFRGRCKCQRRPCHTTPLWDDGLQHAARVTLWQIFGGLQRVQHSCGPQSLLAAWRFVLCCGCIHQDALEKIQGQGKKGGKKTCLFLSSLLLQGWAVGDFLVRELSIICWPIQWKISSTPQKRGTHSAYSTTSRTSSSVSTATKENMRKGSMLLFIISGERNLFITYMLTLYIWSFLKWHRHA